MSCSNAILSGRIGVSLNAYGRSKPVRTDVSHAVKRSMANIKINKQVMRIRLDYCPNQFSTSEGLAPLLPTTEYVRSSIPPFSYCTERDLQSVQSRTLRKNYYQDPTSGVVHCLAKRAGEQGSLLREDPPFFWRTRIVLNAQLIGSTAEVSAGSVRIFSPYCLIVHRLHSVDSAYCWSHSPAL